MRDRSDMNRRGGLTLKTGKIGRVNCIRQQILLPGEMANLDIQGSIKLESLRERDTLRINAHLGVFATPIRWLWAGWPDYIKDGPAGGTGIPMEIISRLDAFGIGAFASGGGFNIPQWWQAACLKVYNEWYKWPEDADITSWGPDGPAAVPLQAAWSRARYDTDPSSTDDYEVASGTEFDVRDLAQKQARFRSAMERDVLSYNRYMELISEMFDSNGSREVDQVPRKVAEVEVGVNPRDLPATDGASLGQWQSLFDFNVDHQEKGIVCPEHCILSYFLTIRFAPVIEGRAPFASAGISWEESVGDAEMIAASPPEQITIGSIAAENNGTVLGQMPAGWRWRAGHDVIGTRIDQRNSFPYMENPTTQANAKDATRIKPAFRSQSLGDYVVDVYIHEDTKSPIGSSLESYFSGMKGSGSKAEFPKQGKMV